MRLLPMLLLSVALATGLFVANTDGAHAADSPAKAKAPPVPLLWKVSDDDNAVYLLGSFHMLKPADYPLARDVDGAFADAESLMFELSPDEMGPELHDARGGPSSWPSCPALTRQPSRSRSRSGYVRA